MSRLPLLIRILFIFSLVLNLTFIGLYVVKKFNTARPASLGYKYNRDKIYKVFPVYASSKVFIGDSQTLFFDFGELMKDTSIKNRGILGDDAIGILKRLNDIIKGKPQRAYIQVGINDFVHNFLPVNTCLNNYRAILTNIKHNSPETTIYIQSIFPSKVVNEDTVLNYNCGLKKLAKEYHLTFIDLYRSFNDNGHLKAIYDSGDGIHLNGYGYLAWKNILTPYLL